MRLPGALVLALAVVPAAPVRASEPSPAPFVDLEAYLRSRAGEPFQILEQPQVRCLVSQLMPAADIELLGERLHGSRGEDVLAARADDGSFLWDGSWKSAASGFTFEGIYRRDRPRTSH